MTSSTLERADRAMPDGAIAIRVMGTPRSGTNLVKYLVERYLGIPVVFDQGFWKHGVFPALMNGRDMQYGELPIVVISKDPVTQLLSWYRLARNNGLFRQKKSFRSFLKEPFEIRQDFTAPRRMEYRFRNPCDYWNQFYFAMNSLRRSGAPVHFVCYEQLVLDPALSLHAMSRFLDLSPPFEDGAAVAMPQQALSASNDIDREASATIAQTRFDPARAELASSLARIGWSHASIILRQIDDDVVRATGRIEFRRTCRRAIGARAILRSLVSF
ncbi:MULTISPECIES: sulfotransferase domain-containing protein [unclassified Mesorhizobium]|uniref:sulfotransferase domain-containing protein n=1 Tax=unclassified Mesorhizobium TaxID=325217 RepID=UPI00086BC8C8|nr:MULTISPECIES: sulfotransferase domain-containing protein [unclassified Mesorhizobium]MBN9255707.1 sulfotransferase domain-containing protein [Mesorhizobium sp.]MBN9272597.1 sulfotransferase domain-containing protein [Mesorhizobium sp.]ODT18503.1 MAG: hypothetical protein ABS57_05955 [Mesorhizobium sp. SCN 65-12]OJX84121.1 MAG: hypothetical protein BGO93_28185 [Mesorhizobium sp. 65-26]